MVAFIFSIEIQLTVSVSRATMTEMLGSYVANASLLFLRYKDQESMCTCLR